MHAQLEHTHTIAMQTEVMQAKNAQRTSTVNSLSYSRRLYINFQSYENIQIFNTL